MAKRSEGENSGIKFYGYGSLSPQGQLHIPKDLRDDMNLPPGKLMVFGNVERAQIIAMPDPGAEALLEAVADLHARRKTKG